MKKIFDIINYSNNIYYFILANIDDSSLIIFNKFDLIFFKNKSIEFYTHLPNRLIK